MHVQLYSQGSQGTGLSCPPSAWLSIKASLSGTPGVQWEPGPIWMWTGTSHPQWGCRGRLLGADVAVSLWFSVFILYLTYLGVPCGMASDHRASIIFLSPNVVFPISFPFSRKAWPDTGSILPRLPCQMLRLPKPSQLSLPW